MGFLHSFEPGTPAWVDLETTAGTTAASPFYCGLFGWRVVARHRPLEDSAGYWVFQQDGKDVGGVGPGQQTGWTFYVSVPDIAATSRAVADNGGAVLVWPMAVFDAGHLAVYTDPLGARFAAWQPELHTGVDVMNEPNSFAWSELSCSDIEVAKPFYNAVFGWEAQTWPFGEGSTYTEFSHPGAERSLAGMVQANEPGQEDALPRWTIYFAVADTDGIASRAAELGGKVSVAPFDMPGVGRIAALTDPEGASFSILQR